MDWVFVTVCYVCARTVSHHLFVGLFIPPLSPPSTPDPGFSVCKLLPGFDILCHCVAQTILVHVS